MLFLLSNISYGQLCGDVDDSGTINILDALIVVQCYVRLIDCPSAQVADINCDLSINVLDALLIARYYVGLIDTLLCCMPTPSPGPTPLPLHVDGKYIKDINNNIVILKGVNTPDLHSIYKGHREEQKSESFDPNGAYTQAIYNYLERLASPTWENVEIMRLCIHPQVCDETCSKGGGEHGWLVYNDPDGYFNNILDPAVQYIKNIGKYVMINWHYVGFPWTGEYEINTVNFWNYICLKYSNDSSVIFNLVNEPGGDGSLETWKDWQMHAQSWIDCIRSGDWRMFGLPATPPADNIILPGAPRWSQCNPYWDNPSHQDDASVLFTGGNIVYVASLYPYHGQTAWIEWIAARAPVMLTEWGYQVNTTIPSGGTYSTWGSSFHDYINSFDNVGWVAWCFDYVYKSVMFDRDWVLLGNGDSEIVENDNYENYMGQFVLDWLNE